MKKYVSKSRIIIKDVKRIMKMHLDSSLNLIVNQMMKLQITKTPLIKTHAQNQSKNNESHQHQNLKVSVLISHFMSELAAHWKNPSLRIITLVKS